MAVAERQDGRTVPWLHFTPPCPEGHDALAADLAAYLRYRSSRPFMTWQNVTFDLRQCVDLARLRRDMEWHAKHGDKFSLRRLHLAHQSCRPDVLALRATLSTDTARPIIYEVKVSRGDFLSDVRSGKWRIYRRLASAVFFAVPDGLVSPKEIPEGAGLFVRKKDHWRIVKRAPAGDWQPTDDYWLTLLVRGRDKLWWEMGRP